MATLDLKAYREALEQDKVQIGENVYPIKRLGFTEALGFAGEVEGVNFADPASVDAFVGRLAELSGIPADVLKHLGLGEIEAVATFFSERQRMDPAKYLTAVR